MKQDDTALVQIHGIAGLLGAVMISTKVALALVRQCLEQTATKVAGDLATDIVLTLKALNGTASTRLVHALRLATSSLDSLLGKCMK